MDLLERYLEAVRFFLPGKQQDDIVRELSENLVSEMEDRAGELGRALTIDEQADILRRHGHPMVVAGRYRSHQQLIGPLFFPIYLFALKLGVGVALLVSIVLAVIAALLNPDPVRQVVQGLQAFPGRALMVFAWTTLGFAALDIAQSRTKLTTKWDPRTLLKVVKPDYPVSRFNALCSALFTVLAMVWLLLLPWAPYLVLGPAAAFVDPAPVWRLVYVPIVLILFGSSVVDLVDVKHPYWTRARSFTRIALNAFNLVVLTTLLNAGALFVPAPGVAWPQGARAEQVVEIINVGFQIGFVAWAVFALVEIVRDLLRLKNRRPTLTADSSPARVVR